MGCHSRVYRAFSKDSWRPMAETLCRCFCNLVIKFVRTPICPCLLPRREFQPVNPLTLMRVLALPSSHPSAPQQQLTGWESAGPNA